MNDFEKLNRINAIMAAQEEMLRDVQGDKRRSVEALHKKPEWVELQTELDSLFEDDEEAELPVVEVVEEDVPAHPTPKQVSADVGYPGTPLRAGSTGPAFNRLARHFRINEARMGRQTVKAVRAFQSSHGLFNNGVVDEETWNALFEA